MCCQFYFDDSTMEDIRNIVNGIDREIYGNKYGDVRPSDPAMIITGRKDVMHAEQMRWGFKSYQNNQLLINARSESALQKVSFRDSVSRRRCIIPAKHFYEWDGQKNKVTFSWNESPVLYMAGFYNQFDGEDRFIILTTAANDSMKKVHDRMPLLLPKEQIEDWIYNDEMVDKYLKTEPPMLTSYREYEQMSLF